jgi:hypothetical protein
MIDDEYSISFSSLIPMSINSKMTAENPFLQFQARSLILWCFLISLGLGLTFDLIAGFNGFNPQDPVFTPIIYILTFNLLSFWAIQRLCQLPFNFKRLIGDLPNRFPWLPTIGIVIAILLFSLGSGQLFFYALSFSHPSFVESLLQEKTWLSSSETFAPLLHNILTIIAVLFVAPVTEELLFRGILLHRWTVKWGVTPALLISSLLFGILHTNVIGLFVFGLMMALLYIKTRTLIVPIACHFLNNLTAVGLEFVSQGSGTTETANILDQLRSDWWVGVVYMVLSAPWLITFIYKNWPKQPSSVPYFTNAPE